MSTDEKLLTMTKEERENYFSQNYFKDLTTAIKAVADGSPFYRKICEKADYMFDEELNYENLHLIPYIQTNQYKEHLGIFPQLTRVPDNQIKLRTVSTSTSGNPSIVARTETDINLLQTLALDSYKDFIWWDKVDYCFNFVPSRFMLKMVAKRSTKQKKAMMFVYMFNEPWEHHPKCENVYMVYISFLKNLWHWIFHWTTETIVQMRTKQLIETLENRKEDEFILLAGNTMMLYNVAEKLFKDEGKTFELGKYGGIATGGGGWDGVKGSLKSKPFSKADMVQTMDEVFGIPSEQVKDIYAFTESSAMFTGHFSKQHQDQVMHVPPYVKIVVRNMETLEPVKPGERGLLEVLTPYGITGNSSVAVMVDDIVKLLGDNDSVCPECGYKGAHFIHMGRQSPPDGQSCSSILDFFEKMG